MCSHASTARTGNRLDSRVPCLPLGPKSSSRLRRAPETRGRNSSRGLGRAPLRCGELRKDPG
eukprot:7193911-Alexandrium_andersonii.AAC.1